ncbi:MAG: 4-alpha-glucanotransferase [Isosphaeraceae bacterium]
MRLPRASGILLHPTSLPGRFGIGDLGPEAVAFLDFLAGTGQHWWQMLPVGPVGLGFSPYQSPSSFAGNPLLLSPERLAADGWLSPRDWADYPKLDDDRVEFEAVAQAKTALLRIAFERFGVGDDGFQPFLRTHAHWLDDYALYMALRDDHGGQGWNDWEPDLAFRRPDALAKARERLARNVRFYQFEQYMFDRQWNRLRTECGKRDIQLIGDLPIFVSQDSSDVWARPELFLLDDQGRPTVVAGVPPDFFSADGQRWGNPLYHWEAHAAENFAWWIARLKASLDRVDLVRLDHFRGFEAYWEVPADAPTAATGRWALGPGAAFLEAVRHTLGGLPLIAEDLGIITFEVEALRDRFDLPGMKVLQFAFGNDPLAEKYLPYSYPNHCIAYTGTHDNDTTVGWLTNTAVESTQTPEEIAAERAFVRRFVGSTGEEIHWDLIRLASASVADTVIFPMQDLLGLDSSARMNVPGRLAGNWAWRYTPGQLRGDAHARLSDITAVYSRWNGEIPVPLRSPRRPRSEAAYLGR